MSILISIPANGYRPTSVERGEAAEEGWGKMIKDVIGRQGKEVVLNI